MGRRTTRTDGVVVPPNWKWDKARQHYRVPVGDQWKVARSIEEGIELIVAAKVGAARERDEATPPFKRLADRWLELRSAKPRTLKVDTHAHRVLVAHFDGAIGDIVASDVIAWLRKRYAQVGAGTVRNEFQRLAQILELAVADGVIKGNPCSAKPVRKALQPYVPEELRLPSDEEVSAVVVAADPFLQVAIELDRCSGLRPGELFGLTAPMVLLGDGDVVPLSGVPMLSVEGQLNNKRPRGDTTLLASTKRPSSVRDVPIAARVQPLLAPLVERAQRSRSGLVFVAKRGGPVWDSTAIEGLALACRRAGVEPFTWRALRHQFASRMLASGCDLKTLQAVLGHKKVAGAEAETKTVTLRSYAHRVTSAARTLELIERGLRYTIGTQMAATDASAQLRGYL